MCPMLPTLHWEEREGLSCLRFVFEGVLEPAAAEHAVEAWREAFASRPSERFVLIWDCTAMTGYESEARVAFTEALSEQSGQVRAIFVISASTVVRMGASLISLATGIDIRAVQDDAEIVLEPGRTATREGGAPAEDEGLADPVDKA